MGLIARQLEAAGIPTLSMSSALSITQAVRPPRATYLDFPLGHTAGKPGDPALQRAILRDALDAFETLREPGSLRRLPYVWAKDDSWKDRVMRPDPTDAASGHVDDRVQRWDTPQYQCLSDLERAEQALAADGCPTCVWLEPQPAQAGAGSQEA